MQWKKLRNMLIHAYYNVPFYHKKFKDSGIKPEEIKEKKDLLKIPVTTKAELREKFPYETVAKNFNLNDCSIARTSGSTGEPLHFALERNVLLYKMAMNLRTCEMSYYRIGEKLFQVSPEISVGSRFVKNLVNWIIKRKIISPFDRNIEKNIRILQNFNPKAIVGYTSYINLLSDHLKKNKPNLNVNSIMTNSEMLLEQVREKISKSFDAEVFDQYGSVEFGRIAGECTQHMGYHINLESVFVEFIKDWEHVASNETGEIIITSLVNNAMPFIRYKIGDLGTPMDGYCSCKRSLPLMKEIKGRIQDLLLTINGNYVIPDKIYRILRDYTVIKQFQFIQKTKEEISLKIVKNKELSDKAKKDIVRRFREYLGNVEVYIEDVEDIPREMGKFKHIKSFVTKQE